MSPLPTNFSQLIGNEQVKQYLTTAIKKRAIGHAFLFSGPEGVGKSQFALAFAARLMAAYDGEEGMAKIAAGIHPDIHFLRPEGKMALHTIDALRKFGEEVYLPPYEASWKVFIINEAERMYSYSANALLKTFEEPPERTLILLITSSRRSLLPTILSRCRSINFHPLSAALIKNYLINQRCVDEERASFLASTCEGSLGNAIRGLNQEGSPARSLLLNLLARGKIGSYRTLQKGLEEIASHIQQLKESALEKAKKALSLSGVQDLSAVQKEQLEKEGGGLAALVQREEVKVLLQAFFSWFRDLELLSLGGDQTQLINPGYHSALERELQYGGKVSLEEVRQAIDAAELALQRSTSLSLCLDTLFLKLNRL